MDSQFHTAGEASHSWWKVQGKQDTSYMAAGKRENKNQGKGKPLMKTSRLMRLLRYQKNSRGVTTPMIQLSATWSLLQHVGIMETTIQDEI